MKKATKFYQLNTIYNTNLLNFFFVCITSLIFLKNYCWAEDLISGYHFSEPSTQKIQDDDFLNPGFIWVENGELLWNKKEQSSQLSCKSCHGAASEMTGVALKYPKIIKEVRGVGLLIGLQLFNDQNDFIKKLMDNKLLTIRAAENVVRILPPLNVKKKEIDLALKIIKKVCKDIK